MSNMDRNEFISAMRGVASSVTVVTTDGPAGRHGATVSAFCSVSADPPTALVCLNSSSRIAELVLANAAFNINVLPDDAKHLAERFCGLHDAEISDRFEGIELLEGKVPAIAGAAIFSCELDQAVPSASHTIMIGKVHEAQNLMKQPLTYLDGGYHHVLPMETK